MKFDFEITRTMHIIFHDQEFDTVEEAQIEARNLAYDLQSDEFSRSSIKNEVTVIHYEQKKENELPPLE